MTYLEMLEALRAGKKATQASEPGLIFEMQPNAVPIFIEYGNSNCNQWHQTRFVLIAECTFPYTKGAPWSFSSTQQAATDWTVVP